MATNLPSPSSVLVRAVPKHPHFTQNDDDDDGADGSPNKEQFSPVPNSRISEIVSESADVSKQAFELIRQYQIQRERRKTVVQDEKRKALAVLAAVDEERHLQQDVVWQELEMLKKVEDDQLAQIAYVDDAIAGLERERAKINESLDFTKDELRTGELVLHENTETLSAVRYKRGMMTADLRILRNNLEEKIAMCRELDIILDEKEWRSELAGILEPELKQFSVDRARTAATPAATAETKRRGGRVRGEHLDVAGNDDDDGGEQEKQHEEQQHQARADRIIEGAIDRGIAAAAEKELAEKEKKNRTAAESNTNEGQQQPDAAAVAAAQSVLSNKMMHQIRVLQAKIGALTDMNNKSGGKYAALRSKYDAVRHVLDNFRISARETEFMTQAGVFAELEDLRHEYRDLYVKHYKRMPPSSSSSPGSLLSEAKFDPQKEHDRFRATSRALSPGGGGGGEQDSVTATMQEEIESAHKQLREMALRIVDYRAKSASQQKAMEVMEEHIMFSEDPETNGQYADALKVRSLDAQLKHVLHHGKIQDPVGLKQRVDDLKEMLDDSRMLHDKSKREIADLKERLAVAESQRRIPVETADCGVWAKPDPNSNGSECGGSLDVYDVIRQTCYDMESNAAKYDASSGEPAWQTPQAQAQFKAALEVLKVMARAVDEVQLASSMTAATKAVEEYVLQAATALGVSRTVYRNGGGGGGGLLERTQTQTTTSQEDGTTTFALTHVRGGAAANSNKNPDGEMSIHHDDSLDDDDDGDDEMSGTNQQQAAGADVTASSLIFHAPPPPKPEIGTPRPTQTTPPPSPPMFEDACINTAPPPLTKDQGVATDNKQTRTTATTSADLIVTRSVEVSTVQKVTLSSSTQVVIPRRDVMLQVVRKPPTMDLALQTKILPPTRDSAIMTIAKTFFDMPIQTDPQPKPVVFDEGVQMQPDVAEFGLQTERDEEEEEEEEEEKVEHQQVEERRREIAIQTDQVTIRSLVDDLGGIPTAAVHDTDDSASATHDSHSRPGSALLALRQFSRPSSADVLQKIPHRIPSLTFSADGSGGGADAPPPRPGSGLRSPTQHLFEMTTAGDGNTTRSVGGSVVVHHENVHDSDVIPKIVQDDDINSVASDEQESGDENAPSEAGSRKNRSRHASPTASPGQKNLLSTAYTHASPVGSPHQKSFGSGHCGDGDDDDDGGQHHRRPLNLLDDADDQDNQHRQRDNEQRIRQREAAAAEAKRIKEERIEQSIFLRLRLTQNALSVAESRALTALEKYQLLRQSLSSVFDVSAKVASDHELIQMAAELLEREEGQELMRHQVRRRASRATTRLQKAVVNAEKYKSFADYVVEYQERAADEPDPDFAFMYKYRNKRMPFEPREAMTPSPQCRDVKEFAGWQSAQFVLEHGFESLRKARNRP